MAAALDDTVRAQVTTRLLDCLGPSATVEEIGPSGHLPRCHVQVIVNISGERKKLFLKALKPERKERELYAYEHILPTLDVRTPRLLGSFPDWEYPTIWLVLEWIEGRRADRNNTDDLSLVFEALAQLHSQSERWQVPVGGLPDSALQLQSAQLHQMYEVIERNQSRLGIDTDCLSLLNRSVGSLLSGPRVWTHSDNEVSNILIKDDAAWLIDWELAMWSTPGVDLGNLCVHLSDDEISRGLTTYRRVYSERVSREIHGSEIQRWLADGLCHDALTWLGFYCEHRDSHQLDEHNWYENWGTLRVKWLQRLSRNAYCT